LSRGDTLHKILRDHLESREAQATLRSGVAREIEALIGSKDPAAPAIRGIMAAMFGFEIKDGKVVDRNPNPALIRFPERINYDQARWLVGLMIQNNPELADNPNLNRPGQALGLPNRLEIVRALVAGEPDDAKQKAMLDRVKEDVLAILRPVFTGSLGGIPERLVVKGVTASAEKPPEWQKYDGTLISGTPGPSAPKGNGGIRTGG
jgi:hypothetical protein